MKDLRKSYEKRVEFYDKRAEFYDKRATKLSKKIATVVNLRLITGVIWIITGGFFLDPASRSVFLLIPFLASLGLFIYLIQVNNKLQKAQDYTTILKRINQQSIKRLNGQWVSFEDQGDQFVNEDHPYTSDLDIFGKGSLFQWLNKGTTDMGRLRLSQFFSEPETEKELITKRQGALKELAIKFWWRQRLQGEGLLIENKKKNKNNNEHVVSWANTTNKIYLKTWLIIGVRVLPVLTIVTLLVSYLTNMISVHVPLSLLIISGFLLLTGLNVRSRELNLVHEYKNMIKTYSRILSHIEKEKFSSPYLKEITKGLTNHEGLTAIKQLGKLDKITDKILNRNNLMFFPINVITLWDYQCMISLESWKRESGVDMKVWLEAIGEIEALASIATLVHDFPQWTFPEIVESPGVFQGKDLGHPLITNKQVCNDVTMVEPNRILLITGSNMSGKSTLLRTVGINLVLAYLGAPVCASYMKCSMMKLHTSMRISDNLEKNISSFYGELLRIKEIVGASKKDDQVFFLIDEIFKGTNSYDRHIGAKMLVKQLYNNGAMGLVSTHDLELAELEKESMGNIKNHHFLEHYEDNEIFFDYKLKTGVSTTRNALYLIKMAGIEIKE